MRVLLPFWLKNDRPYTVDEMMLTGFKYNKMG